MKIKKNKFEEVLPSRPGREAGRRLPTRRLDRSGVLPDELRHRRVTPQALGDGDRDQEAHEADGQKPEQVEPPASAYAHTRRDAAYLRNRSGEGGGIDDVLTGCQLPAVAADDVGRDPRPLTSRRILRHAVVVAGDHGPILRGRRSLPRDSYPPASEFWPR